jgi:hypothetical protein
MSNHLSFSTFNLKETKLQLLVVVLLIVILPILLYLLQIVLSIRGRAVGETRLLLVPRNIAHAPDGSWKFTVGQQVTVDVVLESGANQIESVEPVLFYNPDFISLKIQDPTKSSTNNITCSDFTPIKHQVASVVGGLTINTIGLETGTETGFASTLCSIYPSSDPQAAEIPPPAGFTSPVASFVFTPKQVASDATITIDYTPGKTQNDSSAYKYEGICCSETNVLQGVENLLFDVVEAPTDASLSFSPTSGTYSTGDEFQVQLNLSTGQYAIDSVDAVINYDPLDLEVVKIDDGIVFPSYTKSPTSSGTYNITGQINPASTIGLRGNNLLFSTITFKALRESSSTDVSFYFEGIGARNDTNIVQFQQGTDVLSSIIDAHFVINPAPTVTPTIPQPTPTPDLFPASLSLSPTGGNYAIGVDFTVSLQLTTGPDPVDSVDAVVSYDKRYLSIVSTNQTNTFSSNTITESDPTSTDNIRTITLTNQIGAASSGITASGTTIGTITFKPLQVVSGTPVSLVFVNKGERNDSNVVKYKASTDLLGSVINANYTIVPSIDSLIKSILLKIALQGRPSDQVSKQRELLIKIIGTYFEQNPLTIQTDAKGEATLSSQLESRLTRNSYTLRIKPRGYLQRKITSSLSEVDNVIDLTDNPFKAGDVDGSGQVNTLDWVKYLRNFNSSYPDSDFDGTGTINSFDNTFILLNWFGEDEN